MLTPWNTQRFRAFKGHKKGLLEAGQIFYIQDVRPFGEIKNPRYVSPWQIQSFQNDVCFDRIVGRTHLVTIKNLRDGTTQQVAYWILQRLEDEGFAFCKSRRAKRNETAKQFSQAARPQTGRP